MPASRLLADGSETRGAGPPDPQGRLAARQAHRGVGRRHAADHRARRSRGRATPPAARRAARDRCRAALAALTAATFSRDGKLDDGALDEALATAKQVLRRMKFEQLWFMKRLAARRAGTQLDNRAWSR